MTRKSIKFFILFLILISSAEAFTALSDKCKCCSSARNPVKIETSIDIRKNIQIISKTCCCTFSKTNYCAINYNFSFASRFDLFNNTSDKKINSNHAAKLPVLIVNTIERKGYVNFQISFILKIETVPIYIQNSSYLI